jgi:hypothetical protein
MMSDSSVQGEQSWAAEAPPDRSLPTGRAPGEWDAFISYSRKDSALALPLYAALNSYTPPPGLGLPNRRLRIFIDSSDFVGTEYKSAIRQHLKNSWKLIVLCSPNAVASRFVGPEIADFVELHPVAATSGPVSGAEIPARGDIVTVIYDGFPLNETEGIADPRNAFPETLCRIFNLPIAVDYRGFNGGQHKVQDGKYRDAWYRLLADLFGLDRAAIEERDRRRRLRQMRIRGAIAASVFMGLTSLSIWALWERGIAIDQRTRAEARQLTARAELGLADILSPGAPVVRDALASMSLEPSDDAASVLQTATRRLPPPALGRLPFSTDDGAPADLRFSPDGKFLIGLTDKFILGWRSDDRKQLLRHAIQGKASFAGFNGAGSLAAIRLDQDVSESGGKTELLVLDLAAAKVEQLTFSRVLDCAPQAGELRAVIAEADGRKLSVVALASKQVLKEIELPAPAKMVRLAPQGGFYAVEEAGTASAYSEAPGEPALYRLPPGARPLAIGAYSGFLALEAPPSAAPAPADGTKSKPAGARRSPAKPGGTADQLSGAEGRGLLVVEIKTGRIMAALGADSFKSFLDFASKDRFIRIATAAGIDYYGSGYKPEEHEPGNGLISLLAQALSGGQSHMSRRILTIEHGRATDYALDAMANVGRQVPVVDAIASADGDRLVTAEKDGRITVWHPGLRPRYGSWGAAPMPELGQLAAFDHGSTLGPTAAWQSLPSLFLSPDGRYLASQSEGIKTDPVGRVTSYRPTVRIWDINHQKEIARFERKGGMVVVFSSSGDRLATLSPAEAATANGEAKGSDPVGLALDLWRLPAEGVPVESSSIDLSGIVSPQQEWPPLGIAASPDGRRVVWLTTDGRFWVRKAESGITQEIDNLRPLPARLISDLAPSFQRGFESFAPDLRQNLSRLTTSENLSAWSNAFEPNKLAPKGIPPGLSLASAAWPIAVSRNGCCAAIAIGPMVRVYDLDKNRLLVEKVFFEGFPFLAQIAPLHSPHLLLSDDGRRFVFSVVSWDGVAEYLNRIRHPQQGAGKNAGKDAHTLLGTIQIFSVDKKQPLASIDQPNTILPAPIGAMIPTIWPLAIDPAGHRIALGRINLGDAIPSAAAPTRQVVVRAVSDNAEVFETPPEELVTQFVELWALATHLPWQAAFSADGGRLAIADDQAACGSVVRMTQAMLPVSVPACPDRTGSLAVWDVEAGKQIRSGSFDYVPAAAAGANETTGETPNPGNLSSVIPGLGGPLGGPGRKPLGLALAASNKIIQAGIDDPPEARPRRPILVTEQVPLDSSYLVDRACSRLSRSERSISRDVWQQDLPGETYRAICPADAAGGEHDADRH